MGPEQILLSAEGVAKLADLGMTCKSGSDDIAGSPTYLAPEVVRTETRTLHADMWAMGVSLYQLTRNNWDPPFLRNLGSVEAVMAKLFHLRDEDVRHTGTSALDRLIRGLLVIDMNHRLTSAEALDKA